MLMLLASTAWAQTVTEVILPKYVQGAGTFNTADDRRVPYVCRLTISGLTPNATYRYYNRFEKANTNESSIGSGAYLLVKESGFVRVATASLGTAGRYGELTADATGSYTGWFASEPSHSDHYKPGTQLQVLIVLNNGNGGNLPVYKIRPASIVTVINFGSTASDGTAMWSIADGGKALNFVMLYDNEAGTGRPETGTFIEDAGPGSDLSLANFYADFYANNVNGVDKAWGTIIPNNLSGGIKKIVQYKLQDASIVGYKTSADGSWPLAIGETISTVNTTGGLTTPLILDGHDVALYPPRTLQSVIFTSQVPSQITIGDPDFTLSASATSGLTDFQYTASPSGIVEITGNTVKAIGAGTAIIKARQLGDATYEPGAATAAIIVKKPQHITLADIPNKVYGDDVFTLDVSGDNTTIPITISSSDPGVASVFYESLEDRWKVQIHGAGNVTIIAAQASNTEYAETSASKSFSVQQKALTITADNKTREVNTLNPVFTATYEGFIAGEDDTNLTSPAVFTTTADQNSPIGEYVIKVSGAASPNYSISFFNGTLKVVKKLQTITFPAISTKVYGDAPVNPGATSDAGVTPVYTSSNSAVAVVENNEVIIKGAGTVRITATFPATSQFSETSAERSFTVLKKALEIVADDKTRIYGNENPQLTVTYTGFVYGETSNALPVKPVLQTAADKTSPFGTYAITVSGASSVNYDIKYTYGSLIITKALLTITADNKSKEQGTPNPPLTLTYNGFMNGETVNVLLTPPVLHTSAIDSSPLGEYAITVSGASATNYDVKHVNGILTVNQGSRLLTFNVLLAHTYGDVDFDPGAILSSNEQPEYTSSNPAVATIVNGKVHIISAGSTSITANAPPNSAYSNTPSKSQTLVVNRAPQFIVFEPVPDLKEGTSYEVTVSATTGLDVTLVIENTDIASLEGTRIISKKPGLTKITATQPGNTNYLPAETYIQEIRVTDTEGDFAAVHNAVSINGDGINESLIIDGIENYSDNHLTIVNRNGVKVFEVSNYNNELNAFQGKGNATYLGYLPQGTYFYVLEFRASREMKKKTGYFLLKY